MPAGKMFRAVKAGKRNFRKNKPFSSKQVKAIKKIAKTSGEVKTIDSNTTDAGVILTSAMSVDMPTIAQGDTDATRDGDRIRLSSLQYKVRCNSGTANGLIRCLVIQFGGMRDGESIPTAFSGNNDPTFLLPDLDSVDGIDYKVLYDKTQDCNPQGKNNILFNVKIPSSKLKYKEIEYADAGGLASDILKGRVFLKLYTNNTTDSQITAECNSRVRFYDM